MYDLNKQRPVFELDGEKYVEYPVYDPLIIKNIWRYPFDSIDSITKHNSNSTPIDDLVSQLSLSSESHILIPGVRNGGLFFQLKKFGLNPYGTDANSDVVAVVNSFDNSSKVVYAQQWDLPFSSSEFDLIWCHSSLFMAEHPAINRKELEEMVRLLKPGGILIGEGANGDYWQQKYTDDNAVREYSSKETALFQLHKDTSLAKWSRTGDFIYLVFSFISTNGNIKINHVYYFIPVQQSVPSPRYYHEMVCYESPDYITSELNRLKLTQWKTQKLFTDVDYYASYNLDSFSNSSDSRVFIARKPLS